MSSSKISEYIVLRNREVAALMLWNIGAVRVNIDQPFKLVSGNYSPIYINCRQVISDPPFMHLFTAFARLICERSQVTMDVIAGGETAGIPFAAYVAQSFSLPMVYVRKAIKDHGIGSLVEGVFSRNARVILVEDLVTDAESKMHFIDAIRASGGLVKDVLVLFDRQQGGSEVLASRGIKLHAVTDMLTAMRVAEETRFLSDDQLISVREYLQFPHEWHSKRGLTFTS